MPLPSLVASGQVVAAAHINGIRNYLPLMADGTTGTPGLRFEDDPDTGFYRPASDQLAIVTGGTARVTVGNTGADFGGHGLSALGVLTFHSSGYVSGSMGVGAVPVAPAVKLQVKAATNVNLWVQQGQANTAAIAISGGNDAGSANVPIEFRGTSFSFVGGYIVQDAWTAVTLQNSWASYGGGFPALQCRLGKDRRVEIEGTITGGVTTDGTVIGNALAAFRPSATKVIRIVTVPSAVSGASSPQAQIATNGDIVIYGCQGAGTMHVYGSYAID